MRRSRLLMSSFLDVGRLPECNGKPLRAKAESDTNRLSVICALQGGNMRRAWIVLFLLISITLSANAQMGKSISLAAGSPEDKAYAAISAATDPAQKIALLDQFMKD